MSTTDTDLDAVEPAVRDDRLELTRARLTTVGEMTVRRLLPLRLRRSVGAWCFIDHYGPLSVDGVTGMAVPPHPHIGLQTVTWLMSGNVLHRDSLGSEQMIRPGQLNLMTAGRGIAHAEESPVEHDPQLHGVQLWVALPEASRLTGPGFEHHAALPRTRAGDLDVTVFIGALADAQSPATTYSDLIGAQITTRWATGAAIPLAPSFEHVIFVTDGTASVSGMAVSGTASVSGTAAGGTALQPGSMLYLPPGLAEIRVSAASDSSMLLLGGTPLGEPLLMWWNFVARTPEEIATAAADWANGRFGHVAGAGEPLAAPPLDVGRLRPSR